MTFGALLAFILAVTTASDGTPEVVVPAQAAAAPPGAIASPARCDASPDVADGASGAAGCPVDSAAPVAAATTSAAEAAPPAPPAAAPAPAAEATGALADAARVALAAAESGTPIVIGSAADAMGDAPAIVDAPPAADTPSAADPGPAADAAGPGATAPAGPDAVTPATSEPSALPAAPAGPPLSEAGPLLLERVEDFDGWATERLIEPSGDIVVHTVNRAGTVETCVTVGTLFALVLVAQERAAGGEWMHVARDDASGALVAYTVGVDGEPRAVRLLAAGPPVSAALAVPAKVESAQP